jgi:anti-sigma factor RsiW
MPVALRAALLPERRPAALADALCSRQNRTFKFDAPAPRRALTAPARVTLSAPARVTLSAPARVTLWDEIAPPLPLPLPVPSHAAHTVQQLAPDDPCK